MADGPQDSYAAGIANLAETAKWLIGGIVVAAAGVLAGSPLTNLGALPPGGRLVAALGGAGVAYLLLGVLLWRALDVISTRTTSFTRLIGGQDANPAAIARIEAQIAPALPPGIDSFATLAARSKAVSEDRTAGAEGRYTAFFQQISALEPLLGFEYKRDRFVQMKGLIFRLMPFVIVGVWVFAWAANPKSPPPPTDAPRYVQLRLDADTAPLVAAAEGQACHAVLIAGSEIRVLVVGEDDGRSQLVTTLPEATRCPPIRLVQQNGRVFAAK